MKPNSEEGVPHRPREQTPQGATGSADYCPAWGCGVVTWARVGGGAPVGKVWAGGFHGTFCSAFSPKEDPGPEAEPVGEAEPEVRRAGQGIRAGGPWGFCSALSPRSTALKPWFFAQVPKNEGSTLSPHGAHKIAVSTPHSQPAAGGQETPSVGQQGE